MRAVVVGAGPAGVRAVQTLLDAGLTPIWIDEAPDGGGRIFQRPPPGFARDADALYAEEAPRARALHAALDAAKPRADWRPETLVWNLRPRERKLDLLVAGQRHAQLTYDAIILCTGAMDRVVPLPGWTLPGVTTLGAAQIALKTQGVAIGAQVVLLGTGPLLLLTALQYAKAGARVAAVLDTTPVTTSLRAGIGIMLDPVAIARGLAWKRALRQRGVPVHAGIVPLAIEGQGAVGALRWRDARGREHRTECDAIGMGWGLKPETQLADLAGIPFDFDHRQRLWLPRKDAAGRTPVAHHYLAGDGASIGGAVVAELAGRRAALALLEDAGLAQDPLPGAMLERALRRHGWFRAVLEGAFPYPSALAATIPDATPLCRCETITAGTLRAEAVADLNRAKALTRIGLGRCQGRVCGPPAAEVLAAALGCDIAELGRLRGQMPVKPIPMGAA